MNVFFSFLQNFQPNVTLGPELTNSVQLQVKTVDSTVEAGAQFQQMVNIECTTDFTAQPDLNVNFTCNGKGHKVPLKIPISVNKFMEPTEMDGNNFFARWKNLSMYEYFLLYFLAQKFMLFYSLIQTWPRSPKDLQSSISHGPHPSQDQINRLRIFHSGRHRSQSWQLRLRWNHPHKNGSNWMSS